MSEVMNGLQSDVQSQLQLLKALIQTKSNLMFELNQAKIQNSFRNSNADFKDFKELVNLSKMINHKLNELKELSEITKTLKLGSAQPEDLKQISGIVSSSASNIIEIEKMLKASEDSTALVKALKERYGQLCQEYERKKANFSFDSEFFNDASHDVIFYNSLLAEVNSYKTQLESLNKQIQDIKAKQDKKASSRRSSVEKMKIFQYLSQEALKLQSKFLMKQDLEKTFNKAQKELEKQEARVNKEKSKIEKLKNQLNGSLDPQDYNNELKLVQEQVGKIEGKIENLYKEREELINPRVLGLDIRNENQEDSVTVSLITLMTGFNEMRREKETLFQENQRLKEKITNLFGVGK